MISHSACARLLWLSPTARAGRGLALRFSRLADWLLLLQLLSLPLPVLLAMTAAITRRRQNFTAGFP